MRKEIAAVMIQRDDRACLDDVSSDRPANSGGSYGMMSASWDPDKEGSALGAEEPCFGAPSSWR